MSAYRTTWVDGTEVFYREGGGRQRRRCCCYTGFDSSAQYQLLMERLEDRYSPDSDPTTGIRSEPALHGTKHLDRIADVIEGFTGAKGVDRFSLYMFVRSAVGFRLPRDTRGRLGTGDPERKRLRGGARAGHAGAQALLAGPPANEEAVRGFLQLEATRSQYLDGVAERSLSTRTCRSLISATSSFRP